MTTANKPPRKRRRKAAAATISNCLLLLLLLLLLACCNLRRQTQAAKLNNQQPPLVQIDGQFLATPLFASAAAAAAAPNSNLQIASISVPQKVRENQLAVLQCLYNVSSDERLHAVKWFKDASEFYRFAPQQQKTKLAFPLEGLSVDVQHSNDSTIVLRNVNKLATGVYKCHVSVEGSFRSISAERHMQVVSRNGSAWQGGGGGNQLRPPLSSGQRPQRAQPSGHALGVTSAAGASQIKSFGALQFALAACWSLLSAAAILSTSSRVAR